MEKKYIKVCKCLHLEEEHYEPYYQENLGCKQTIQQNPYHKTCRCRKWKPYDAILLTQDEILSLKKLESKLSFDTKENKLIIIKQK